MELSGVAAFERHYGAIYGARWKALSAGLRRSPLATVLIPPFLQQIPEQLESEQCVQVDFDAVALNGSSYYRTTELPFCYGVVAFDASRDDNPDPRDLRLYEKKVVLNANSFVSTVADCAYRVDVGLAVACHCLGAAPGDKVLDVFGHSGAHSVLFASLLFHEGDALAGVSCENKSTTEVVALLNRLRERVQPEQSKSLLVCSESRKPLHERCRETMHKFVPERLLSSTCIQLVPYSADDHKLERFGRFDRIFLRLPEFCDCSNPYNWSKRALKANSARALSALNSASKLLKPGGTILYCTQSVDPLENELVVHTVLQSCVYLRHDPLDVDAVLAPVLERLNWRAESKPGLLVTERRKYGIAMMPDETPHGPLYLCRLVSTNK